jgi:hypothetical protein
MDMDLRNVSAPAEARQRIQLMTGAWDQAAQVLDDLQRGAEANARGNQVADDLNLSPCASAGAGLAFGVY